MEKGILACLVLASPSLPLPDQIIFDVFEYGGSYKHLNSPMRFLPPSSQVTEVMKSTLKQIQSILSKKIIIRQNSDFIEKSPCAPLV